MTDRTSNQEGFLTSAQVKAMRPGEMADFLHRNSGDANFQWQVREAILNRASQIIDDLSTKLKAAGEALARSNHEIERLSAPDETSRDAEDAAKWRALRNCARIKLMGAAGLTDEAGLARPDGHVGLEFWTHHKATGDAQDIQGRDYLDRFIAKAMRQSPPKTTCELGIESHRGCDCRTDPGIRTIAKEPQ